MLHLIQQIVIVLFIYRFHYTLHNIIHTDIYALHNVIKQYLLLIVRISFTRFPKIPPQSQFSADVEGKPYKTTVVVENLVEHYLYVDSYSTFGFKLNNGFRIMGPCALFPRTALAWNVSLFLAYL